MSNQTKIQIPNYLDASISTLIKDIPQIITNNNKENLLFFNSLFNFGDKSSNTPSRQYIKTSLDTTGYVKANSGEFINIKFNVIDENTKINAFKDIVVNHNNALSRFKEDVSAGTYCHDSYVIKHNENPLSTVISNIENNITNQNSNMNIIVDKLNNLELTVGDLCKNLDINKAFNSEKYNLRRNSSNNEIELYNMDIVSTFNNSTNSYTYPIKVYSGETSMKFQTKYDYLDINNNVKFRYYNVNSIYTKVNNQFINSLNCDEISLQTNILIDKTHDNDLIIKLYYDGSDYTCVKILKDDIDLCRLLLTCIDINEYGPKWYITSYSGNIELIKIKNNQ